MGEQKVALSAASRVVLWAEARVCLSAAYLVGQTGVKMAVGKEYTLAAKSVVSRVVVLAALKAV